MLRSKSSQKMNQKSGQSMVEMLFGVMFSLMIMFVALNYFRLLRSTNMREEAVRNAAFAKMANVGTLTTPSEHLGGRPVMMGAEFLDSSLKRQAFGAGKNNDTSVASECFILTTEEPLGVFPLVPRGLLGSKPNTDNPTVNTFAVVNRKPTSLCGQQVGTKGLP